jgi:hypothetical protein
MGENRRAELSRGQRPQAGLRLQPQTSRPAKRRGAKILAGREGRPRGQRVLDGVSGARAGGRIPAAPKAFNTLSFENEI